MYNLVPVLVLLLSICFLSLTHHTTAAADHDHDADAASGTFHRPMLLTSIRLADDHPHYHSQDARRLDISQECLNQTMNLWYHENVPMEWSHEWTHLFNYSYHECTEFPCHMQKHSHQQTQSMQMKQQCEELNGQYVQYTFRFRYQNGTMDDETEITNIPQCIAKTCDASQFASYYQGYLVNQLEYYGIDGDIDGEVYVISESSSPHKKVAGIVVGWSLISAWVMNTLLFWIVM